MEERTPPQPQLKTAVELLGATLMKDIEREDGSLASVSCGYYFNVSRSFIDNIYPRLTWLRLHWVGTKQTR